MDNIVETTASSETGLAQEHINLRYYWHVILERRWLVISAFVSVFILCLIYLYKAPRIYEATARLQIDRESENVLNIRDAFAIDGREQDYLQTQYKNLQSRTLIQSVINKLKLDKDPRYATSLDVLRAVYQDIDISPIRLSRLVDVKVEHTEAKKAAAIANSLVSQFIEDNLDQKKQESLKALDRLKMEAIKQKEAVKQADSALQEYMKKLNNVSLDEKLNIVFQALRSVQEQLAFAQSKATIAAKLNQEVQGILKSGISRESIPQVANDTLVQQLKGQLAIKEAELDSLLKRYGNKWPDVQQKQQAITSLKKSIQDSAEDIIKSISSEAKIAEGQVESVQALVDQWEQKQLALGQERIRYDELVREADVQKQLYLTVEKGAKDLEITINNKLNNMRVVDEAVAPLKWVKPRVLLTLFLSVFGGMAVACGLAFFVNYLDDSIKTQDDVEIYLRLPFLGYVPNIKSNSVVERDLQAHLHPQSTAAEGFRTIRAAVALMPKSDKFRLTVITSTIPGEGKSLVASNLAIVTAQTGQKTLLIDADLRRPSVHKVFQLHSPIGLSAYLTENVDRLEDIVHPTEVPNMSVICGGAIPSNPSELAGSKRMKQLLHEASGRYDRIFLDCPPVSAVSDPLVIAAMADGVVFLTKFNKIRREHARKSIQRIQDAGIHVLGIVLNDIDFEGRDSYYYSYYYYQNRYYSSHYSSQAKAKAQTRAEPAAKA